MTMEDIVRVRLAPSPTGKFHIGTARTALFNFLFAKKAGGKFVLRIEDTDKDRSEEIYNQDILDGLKWLGLLWDEGPDVGGPFEPYFQQERGHIYQEYLDLLLEQKKAYKCFCTAEELEAERSAQQAANQPTKYSGKCRHLTADEIQLREQEKRPYAIRFVVEPQTVTVNDLVRGEIQFDAGLFGDVPIVRRDGTPLFLFTNVIDDATMEITHVFRGEEHLNNTAKQILLAQALNLLPPQFGHFPLIMNKDRTKMSKRKNPVAVSDDYRDKGFLPEAVVNYIALLGWSSGTDREIYSLDELTKEFQIERVGKSSSIFDEEKLLWMNGYYIRHLPLGELAERSKPFIKDESILKQTQENPDYFLQALATAHDRLKRLDEVEEQIRLFYLEPVYAKELLVAKKSTPERAKQALVAAQAVLATLEVQTLDGTEQALRTTAKENELTDGELLWTVRVALSGLPASPGAIELIEVLGKERVELRLSAAIKLLS